MIWHNLLVSDGWLVQLAGRTINENHSTLLDYVLYVCHHVLYIFQTLTSIYAPFKYDLQWLLNSILIKLSVLNAIT